MDQAETWLVEYSKSNPGPEMQGRSEKRRAQLFLARGLAYLRHAEGDRKTAEQKQEYRDKARSLLTNAWDTLKRNAAFFQAEFQKIVDDPQDKQKTREARDRVYGQYVHSRILLASASESLAETYPPGSTEYTTQLQSALKEHQYNREKFRNKPLGPNAILGVARCSSRLGLEKDAMGACLDIFDQPDNAFFRPLKKQAALIAAKMWQKETTFAAC